MIVGGVSTQIFLVGQSMGSAVATMLAKQLQEERKPLAGLILFCPFSSIPDAMLTYGSLPLMMPLRFIPNAEEWVHKFAHIKFDNHQTLKVRHSLTSQSLNAPFLLRILMFPCY